MTVLVVALFAVAGWLFWWPVQPVPPTHLLTLTTGESDSLWLPPILFEEETLAPLQDLVNAGPHLRLVNGAQAMRSVQPTALVQAVNELDCDQDDRLLVYVSGHGISDVGEAYILGPGYDPASPSQRRFLAKDLIQAVAELDVDCKVVVFDCCRLATVPRMGMALNEFSSQVEQVTRETDDPKLWVVLAAGERETSSIGLVEQRSALGARLVDALQYGDATAYGGDADHNLSVAELADYLVTQCATARVATPRPLVICGKQGAVPSPNAIVLQVPIVEKEDAEGAIETPLENKHESASGSGESSQNKITVGSPRLAINQLPAAVPSSGRRALESASASGSAPVDSSTVEATKSNDKTAEDAEPVPAEVAASKQEPPAAPADIEPTAPQPEKPLIPDIVRAWQLRDTLEQTSSIDSPVMYAPQLWCNLNEFLVQLELGQHGYRQLSPSVMSNFDTDTAMIADGLAELAGEAGRAGDAGYVTQRLRAELAAFESSRPYANLNSLPSELAQALMDLRRYRFLAQRYVRWHAMNYCTVGGSRGNEAAEIKELLAQLVLADRGLEKLEQQADEASLATELWLRQIDSVRWAARQIESDFERKAADVIRSSNPLVMRQMEALLATDVCSAEQRQRLFSHASDTSVDPQARVSSDPGWAAALDHLQLEISLVLMADPQFPSVGAWQTVLDGRASTSEEELRPLFREAGLALREFYAKLPDRLNELTRSDSEVSDRRLAERLVCLLHPRDAVSIASADERAIGFLDTSLRPPALVELVAPTATDLNVDQWEELRWQIHTSNVVAETSEVVIDEIGREIEVRFANQSVISKPGEKLVVPLTPGKDLVLEARANRTDNGPAASRARSIRLSLKVELPEGERQVSSTAVVRLPLPNHLELHAVCLEPRLDQSPHGSDALEIRPFAGRPTTFQFELMNHSGKERALEVEFWTVPNFGRRKDVQEAGWPPGRLLAGGQPAEVLKRWVESGMPQGQLVATCSVAVPSDATPVTLPLATAAATASGALPADGSTPEATAAPAIDVTHGLVCRITNKADSSEQWLKWVEIIPCRPSEFLQFSGSFRSTSVTKEVRIRTQCVDLNGDGRVDLPPAMAEEPVTLTFWGDGVYGNAGVPVRETIDGVVTDVTLRVVADQQVPRRHILPLDVDGFPRAELWEADAQNETVTRLRDRRSITVDWLAMAKSNSSPSRIYATIGTLAASGVQADQWDAISPMPDDDVYAFDVSRGVRPMQMRLRVDAPGDAFNSVGDGDRVVLTWDLGQSANPSQYAFSDRDVRSQIVQVTPTGGLTVLATLDDLTFELPPPGLNRGMAALSAMLWIDGRPSYEQQLQVVFDDAPPILTAALARKRIPLGTPLFQVNANIEDLSGVASMAAWVLPELPATAAELDPKAAIPFPDPDPEQFDPRGPQVRRLALSLPAPREAPGTYLVVLQATDRSGQVSTTFASPLRLEVLEPPKAASMEQQGPLVADLKGMVMVGSKPAPAGIKVYAKEQPSLSATTDSGGKFVISQIKVGNYTLVVEGTMKARPVTGEQAVALEKRADFDGHLLKAQWNLAPPPQ